MSRTKTKSNSRIEYDPIKSIFSTFRDEAVDRLERREESDPTLWDQYPITKEYLVAQVKAELIQLEAALANEYDDSPDSALVFRHAIDGAIALVKIAYAFGDF